MSKYTVCSVCIFDDILESDLTLSNDKDTSDARSYRIGASCYTILIPVSHIAWQDSQQRRH